MAKRVTFSVIVPIYNVEPYLAQCVDSILAQDFYDYEVLLIDDGSTDASGAQCDQYAAQSDKVTVIHKTNGGLSDARNCGLAHMHGRYAIFIDSDDWIEPKCFSTFATLVEQKKPDVLITTLIEAYEDYRKKNDRQLESYMAEAPFTRKRALYWELCVTNDTWPSPKCIYSAEFLRRAQLQFAKGRLHEDIDWTSRVLYAAQTFMGCGMPWYNHRKEREGSISNVIKVKRVVDVIEIGAWHYDYWKAHQSKENDMILKRIMRSVYGVVAMTGRCPEEDGATVAKCLQENRRILRIVPSFRYGLFSVMARVFGVTAALKLLMTVKSKRGKKDAGKTS